MSLSASSMASYDLPEDVVIHILSRLPVLSLMRFKCVCKSWCSLIQSPNFIAQHLNQTTLNNNHGKGTLLVKRHRRITDKDEFFLLSDDTFEFSLNLDLPYFHDDWQLGRLHMVASCNGIICLYNKLSDHLILWNPATREVKDLPESTICRRPRCTGDVGFGFDLKTNDFKVVRVVYLTDKSNGRSENLCRAELYSLSTDSWRLIDAVPPASFLNPTPRPRAYVNGIYSWWAFLDLMEEMLISFDMSNEVFLSTPLPPVCARSAGDYRPRSFAALNGSVALILFHHFLKQCSEVWVLNEYGVKGSWTKLYMIEPISVRMWWPLGFWKNGEMFVELEESEVDREERLFLIDPVTQGRRNLQVDSVGHTLEVIVYVESLVSIRGGSGPVICNRWAS